MRRSWMTVGSILLSLSLGACKEKSDPAPHSEDTTAALASVSLARPSAEAVTKTATEGAADAKSSCDALCRIGKQLKCKATTEQCLASCAQMTAIAQCRAELAGVFKCLLGQTEDHWECDEEGQPAIKEEYCASEQLRYGQCVTASAR